MRVKVCGMRDPDNVKALEKTEPDYVGFIFYEGTKRCVDWENPIQSGRMSPVGVFVNAEARFIEKMIGSWKLEYVQLHGDESPEFCAIVSGMGVKVIKAFAVDQNFDFSETEPYHSVADYFLFDTKGEKYGGTGIVFDWSILKNYKGNKPFFLSGGIHPGMTDAVKAFDHSMLHAIDINSGFEDEPGMKNTRKIKKFLHEILN